MSNSVGNSFYSVMSDCIVYWQQLCLTELELKDPNFEVDSQGNHDEVNCS